jgi:hypothetical protein
MSANQRQHQTIYALIPNDSSWEDIVLFLSEKDAEQALINNPKKRIEQFVKTEKSEYIPSYLVTYGKEWNNQIYSRTVSEPKLITCQTIIDDELPVFTKYYRANETSNNKCSSR